MGKLAGMSPLGAARVDRRTLRSAVLRALLALCLTGALLIGHGEALMQVLRAPLASLIDAIDPHHRVIGLSVTRSGADTVIRLDAGLRRLVVTGSHVTFADPRARAVITTPLAAFWLAPTALIALLAAWPAQRVIEWPLRSLLALPALALLLAVDAPFVLDAHLWALHRDAHAPDSTSPILVWSAFLKSGGRFVLAGVVALPLIALASRTAARVAAAPRSRAGEPIA